MSRQHISEDPITIVTAALRTHDTGALDRARALATSSRDRQIVAIAHAYLDGQIELVNALAREHLVDYPESVIVAKIAARAARP